MNQIKTNAKMLSIVAATFLVSLMPLRGSAAVPVPDDEREFLPTIYEAALANVSNPKYSTLVALLGNAFGEDLEEIFDGVTKYTVFGPTNDAFTSLLGSLSEAQQTALLDVENGLLAKILLYHVALGDWYAETFPVGALQMGNSDLASVYWNGEVIEIEGAMIMGETLLENGVFYGIDAVIVPPGFVEELNAAAAS